MLTSGVAAAPRPPSQALCASVGVTVPRVRPPVGMFEKAQASPEQVAFCPLSAPSWLGRALSGGSPVSKSRSQPTDFVFAHRYPSKGCGCSEPSSPTLGRGRPALKSQERGSGTEVVPTAPHPLLEMALQVPPSSGALPTPLSSRSAVGGVTGDAGAGWADFGAGRPQRLPPSCSGRG